MNSMESVISDAVENPLIWVSQALGQPAISLPGISIYEGDCLTYMERLPAEIVSLTLTSPPYNIGKEYESPLPLDDYIAWSERWMMEVHRLTSTRGAFWLNLGYLEVSEKAKALPIPYLLWNRIPFYIVQEVVWNYGAGVAARRSFSPRNEKLLWCVKNPVDYTFNLDDIRDKDVKYPLQRKNGKLKCNPNGKNPTDVWYVPKVTSGSGRASKERTDHPAQFPIALVDRIVRGCSNKGELVLDPFIGSGSTAEACLRSGRACLGFEVKADYIEIAARRLKHCLKKSLVSGHRSSYLLVHNVLSLCFSESLERAACCPVGAF